MVVSYQDPFKVYAAMTPGYTSEATADSYNLLRACLLTWSYFFASEPDADTAVDVSRIRSQLGNTATHFFPRQSDGLDTDGVTVCQDYAPILIDVENYLAFTSQGATAAQAFTSFGKASTIIDTVKEIFPNRRVAWYGWAPHNDWYGVTNWLSVKGDATAENYASYLSVFTQYQRENERVRHGGTTNARTVRGPLRRVDFLAPDLYLPNNTTFLGDGYDWTANADCVAWAGYFTESTAEAKARWQKPCLPYVQPYIPTTTTYVGDAFFTHMLDTAYADTNCDGVVIYFPSGATWTTWRELVRDWAVTNLGA